MLVLAIIFGFIGFVLVGETTSALTLNRHQWAYKNNWTTGFL